MSRIAVVAPRPAPYVHGGAERHWDALVRALVAAGHDAELVAVDAPEATSAEVLASYRRFVELDVSGFDAVISAKYPSWMVQHRRHVRHLNHPLRGLYDLYPSHLPPASVEQRAEIARRLVEGPGALLDWAEAQDLERPEWGLPGPWMQAVVQSLDQAASRLLHRQAAVSETVAGRPGYASLLGSGPVSIIPPLTDLPIPPMAGPEADGVGAHFLAFGRLTAEKRFDLAIAAFDRSGLGREHPEPFELWIAGTGPEGAALQALADRTPGVRMLGRCSDEELARYLASAIAVVLTPRDEDYGLVAAEALGAGRPVLTTTDSGGIAEQVRASAPPAGVVVPPMARFLGTAMRELALDPATSDRMGRAGRDRVRTLTWQPLVDLVECDRPEPRPRVLMLSTFVADPVTGGGSRRLRAVANRLQSFADVTVLTLTNEVTGIRNRRLADGVVQLAVGRSRPHLKADHEMQAMVGVPVDDIAIGPLHRATPAFAPLLSAHLEATDLIVLAHPFLAPAIPPGTKKPTVYDAHNVEIDLKERL
ncbi:MAG: glycosyltransferase family 4 protein, partial [Actinomycetota bacterium]|nr:glycosyltransferase family 4 protein [Actinomycetota bacterium]